MAGLMPHDCSCSAAAAPAGSHPHRWAQPFPPAGPHPRTLLVARGPELLRLDLKPPGVQHGITRLLQLAGKDADEGSIWGLAAGAEHAATVRCAPRD